MSEVIDLSRVREDIAQSAISKLVSTYVEKIEKKLSLPTRKVSVLDEAIFRWVQENPYASSTKIAENILLLMKDSWLQSIDSSTLTLFVGCLQKTPYWELSELKNHITRWLEIDGVAEIDVYHSIHLVELLKEFNNSSSDTAAPHLLI